MRSRILPCLRSLLTEPSRERGRCELSGTAEVIATVEPQQKPESVGQGDKPLNTELPVQSLIAFLEHNLGAS